MIDAWGMLTFGCGIAGWLLTGRDPNWLFVIGAGAGMYAMVIMMLVQGVQLVSVPILTSADCPTPTTGADGDQPPDPKV